MDDSRVIKKYPNRRLYDTELSKYITLEDVRRLVREGVDFVVRDSQTEDDLTRSILLQVIAEQEAGGKPMFTTPVLMQIIQFYGDAAQGLAADFLQRSLLAFGRQQQLFRRQLEDLVPKGPAGAVADLTEQNLALWRDMQRAMFGGQPPPADEPRTGAAKKPPGKPKQGGRR